MSDGLVNVDADKPAGHVSELVFVFKKGKSRKMFGSRSTHIDVELLLIQVCNRREGHIQKFDVRNVMGVHVDKSKSKGVSIESHIFTRAVE